MAIPTDPLLATQWHLNQTVVGLLDLNVLLAWQLGYTGAGTFTLVIDDGFDYTHPDLAPNYDTFLDFDWDANNNGDGVNDFDPFGQASDAHGTAVAGIIGADDNGTGAVGVAFDTTLVGYRIHAFINDGWLQDIRDSIHHAAVTTVADVTNISQGIANDENSEFGVGYNAARFDEIETSITTAVTQGRGGLGMTIVKSAGNSRTDDYDVNADDWTNDTRQVVVAAVDQDGFVSSYSSYGAALLVSAFGTPIAGEVVTTDRVGGAGYDVDDFTESFNGTSAAAPMVSGIVSLMYDANAGLGWRDVQTILAYTARHVGSNIGTGIAGAERYAWQWNAASNWNGGALHFSNDYGYGLVDATAAVLLAETWLDSTSAQASNNEFTNFVDMLNVATAIPDGNATGTTFTGNATFDDEVERVTVQITFSTTFTADMEIYVTSPDGTVSELIDDVGGGTDFNGTWTFETQAFRGERAAGQWSVRIVDDAGGDVLTVSDIVLQTFGRASSDDRYVFTNEYGTFGGVAGHNTITDTNNGIDQLNAAAVTSNSIVNLTAGSVSTIAGQSLTIAVGTNIENAYGGIGNDNITGNGLNNRLVGGRGNDTLNGGIGIDTMLGGAGNDTYVVDNAGDIVDESIAGSSGTDTVYAAFSYSLANSATVLGSLERLVLTGAANINGTGNGLSNLLIGNSGNNTLNGGLGTDTMRGLGGNDVYVL
ncbi:S8 family serine peptidase, partial [Mesorhizobium sp. ZC-5]|uniref:S8 family serine peptidase n=1 Tax=Mesorhizobium sp. ZC-5 TaxID=2986066 RepID=UPI0021E90BB1